MANILVILPTNVLIASVRRGDTYPLYKSLREKVFYKLPEVLLCYSVMEKRHFAIYNSQYGWCAMSAKVIS